MTTTELVTEQTENVELDQDIELSLTELDMVGGGSIIAAFN